MSARYETPLLVDVKIEELKFEGQKYIIYILHITQNKPKTHDNKIHAPVTTWPQEKFGNTTPILMHGCFHKNTWQRFSSKRTCQISNLNKSLIAGNHVYLNCSAFLALQTDWWVRDMRPHYLSMSKEKNWTFEEKKYKISILRSMQTKNVREQNSRSRYHSASRAIRQSNANFNAWMIS